MNENDREMIEIEALTAVELADLIAVKDVLAESHRPVWMDDLTGWMGLRPGDVYAWMSNNSRVAYRDGLVPESCLDQLGIPTGVRDELWTQAGGEWHHAKRVHGGEVERIRFFRTIDLVPFIQNHPTF